MWKGTEAEFENIINKYKSSLYGTAFAYLNSNSEIDDVVQETFIEFYYKYDTIRDKSKIGAWLCGVCRNIALKRLRATRFTLSLDTAVHKSEQDPADLYEKVDKIREIRSAISRLSNPIAETVSLYYITGLSVAKISELLCVPQGTVKSRLYEGRRKLKGELNYMMESELKKEYTTDITEKIRKIISEADSAMKNTNDNAAVLMLDSALNEIGENHEHYRLLAELYRKRAKAIFMTDRQKATEDNSRALEYAKLTKDEIFIAEYMLDDAFNAASSTEQANKMRDTYKLAQRNDLNGICAEAAYWIAVNEIKEGNEQKAREGLALALAHYEKIKANEKANVCEGDVIRIRAMANAALQSLNMLRDVGREMGDWSSCNTFCQIFHRYGETITCHNNYGWDIPGRQYHHYTPSGLFERWGYLFADELLENDSITYEYFDYYNVLIKRTYTVVARDEEVSTPAGHFSGCIKLQIKEEISDIDTDEKCESLKSLINCCSIICPGIGEVYYSKTYPNSIETNEQYAFTSMLCAYRTAEKSTHVIPFEEGNEFEYISYNANMKPISDEFVYRDIYKIDTVVDDSTIYMANYGYLYEK